MKKLDTRRILCISDQHHPFEHPDMLRFTVQNEEREVPAQYHVGQVIKTSSKRGNGFKDLTGMKFNNLTVIEYLGNQVVSISPVLKFKSFWLCRCDCGNEISIRANSLASGAKSCGCQKSEITRDFNKRTKSKLTHDTFSVVWQSYKRGAKCRGLEFLLNKDQFYFLTQGNCHYCGIEPKQIRKPRVKGKSSNFVYNGIDRVNSTIGYLIENCVPCCKRCNYMKMNFTVEEFKEHLRRILNHLKIQLEKFNE